ncbi:MAG TPA: hypothetical protein VEZ50_07440 [Nodosilinea sp.]|nr:hypothetical protein [Nodosilinea sp.]
MTALYLTAPPLWVELNHNTAKSSFIGPAGYPVDVAAVTWVNFPGAHNDRFKAAGCGNVVKR